MAVLTSRRIPRKSAFWVVAVAFLTMMCGAGAPSPLYSVYQEEWDFSAVTLTAVFAVYVAALLTSLLTVGALSDHIGRKPVLVAALLVLAAAMVVFIAADSVAWLVVARLVQGLATGAATGAFTATVIDLQPHEKRGPLINSIAPTSGLAIGALGSGLLVQFAPAPTTSVYVLLAVGYIALALAVTAVPETSAAPGFSTRAHLLRELRPSASVPRVVRTRFVTVVPCLIATWSLGGLYLSLSPSITAAVFDVHNHVIGGAEIFALFGSGALGATFASRRIGNSVMVAGCVVVAAGVAITVVSLTTESVAVFFVGSIVSGLGFGSSFLSAMRALGELTPPQERGKVFASVFAVSYTAFSVPAVAAGFAVAPIGLLTTSEIYALAVIVLALTAAVAFTIATRREARRELCPAVA